MLGPDSSEEIDSEFICLAWSQALFSPLPLYHPVAACPQWFLQIATILMSMCSQKPHDFGTNNPPGLRCTVPSPVPSCMVGQIVSRRDVTLRWFRRRHCQVRIIEHHDVLLYPMSSAITPHAFSFIVFTWNPNGLLLSMLLSYRIDQTTRLKFHFPNWSHSS